MVQQDRRVKASEDGLKQIKAAMEKEGYTQNSAKTPIYKVTRQELERYIKEKFKENLNPSQDSTISLNNEELTDLSESHLQIFSTHKDIDKSSRDIVRTYIETEIIAPIQLDDFLNNLENKRVTAFQLTDANWRTFCTGKDSRKSKEKGQEKLLPESVFNAFCKFLGLNPSHIVYKPDNTTDLEEKLKLFNHEIQIDLLIKNAPATECKAFLISNDCLYSRSWMLHRLEKAICDNINKINKCSIITLNNFSENLYLQLDQSIERFINIFHENKLYDKLKKEHIILVINIKSYCYDINNIQKIYGFYKTMYDARPRNYDGYLLMFLLAKDSDFSNLNNCRDINEYIIQLPKANYDLSHLTKFLEKENIIIDNCQNNGKNLLIKIYQQSKIDKDPTTLKIWSNYPWN
ncbi:hypothetical protein FJR38_24670 [Anabaena sp. UHCC 0253]|uniref:hypothetical protein n=1 Tax=Anabaena sp. UHCC 0253 TaxID=2590019 RepID=UPI00144521D9|nr:hypothetical protein [Anabaena sp. UHCC 0253]MTJ55633.1 hypothetical protein [Anabaena sp. UHCC 0253]